MLVQNFILKTALVKYLTESLPTALELLISLGIYWKSVEGAESLAQIADCPTAPIPVPMVTATCVIKAICVLSSGVSHTHTDRTRYR